MGVATIWVMLFHSSLSCPISVVQHIINTGYIGVDIFAFLFGMSMFYSFSVNCECDAKEFLKRRMTRIIPTYLVFFVLTKLYSFLVERGGNFSSLYEDWILCLLGGFSNISRIRNLLVNVFVALGTILLSVLYNRIIDRAKMVFCKAVS